MPNKFDINSKPLSKAKPCIVELMRDSGEIEWYENCKAGELLEIKSGRQKAFINLDNSKIKRFNIPDDEGRAVEYKKEIEGYLERVKSYNEEKERIEKRKLEELNKIESMKVKDTNKDKRKEKAKTLYEKEIEKLKGKYIKLNKDKLKNFGTESKPKMGFVCYEREFNALPQKAKHDARAITQWLDAAMKNAKDFMAQRMEAGGQIILYIVVGVVAVMFVYGKFVAPMIAKVKAEQAVETAKSGVAVINSLIWMIMFKLKNGKKKVNN